MGIRPYTNSDKMLSCEDVACVVTARKEVNSSTEIKSAEFFCFLESMQMSFISLVREVEHFFSRPASLRVPAFFCGWGWWLLCRFLCERSGRTYSAPQ